MNTDTDCCSGGGADMSSTTFWDGHKLSSMQTFPHVLGFVSNHKDLMSFVSGRVLLHRTREKQVHNDYTPKELADDILKEPLIDNMLADTTQGQVLRASVVAVASAFMIYQGAAAPGDLQTITDSCITNLRALRLCLKFSSDCLGRDVNIRRLCALLDQATSTKVFADIDTEKKLSCVAQLVGASRVSRRRGDPFPKHVFQLIQQAENVLLDFRPTSSAEHKSVAAAIFKKKEMYPMDQLWNNLKTFVEDVTVGQLLNQRLERLEIAMKEEQLFLTAENSSKKKCCKTCECHDGSAMHKGHKRRLCPLSAQVHRVRVSPRASSDEKDNKTKQLNTRGDLGPEKTRARAIPVHEDGESKEPQETEDEWDYDFTQSSRDRFKKKRTGH